MTAEGENARGTRAIAKVGRRPYSRSRKPRRLFVVVSWATASLLIVLATTAWLGSRASIISAELGSAAQLVTRLQAEVGKDDSGAALQTVRELRAHTATAKETSNDPIWKLASIIPLGGGNFSAVTEIARSADDVATLGVAPLINIFDSLNWDALVPGSTGTNMYPLQEASPTISSAAHAVRSSVGRLERIDTQDLLPQIAEPLNNAREQLRPVSAALDTAAHVAEITPGMLGGSSPRSYLVMIQNNAEARATGGIPGALAILTLESGKLSLQGQSSAGELGIFSPGVNVSGEQEQIYSRRLGKFMQDVNLTPDFPTSASTAQAMWQMRHGSTVDGVISLDPVALGYILEATGPVSLSTVDPAAGGTNHELPTELTSQNVVQTLLSDVYAEIEQPKLQDAYFAAVAQEVFSSLSKGNDNAKGLLSGLSRGVEEGRILLWSTRATEQQIISQYAISGGVTGPSIAPAQFGLYFNDGTGAKMDYYVHRTVQLIKECPRDGYEEITVRVTSTNTAPSNAATSLPAYVTGGGIFGVPPGSVQTNIVAYGPAQANVETAKLDGQRTEFAPYLHGNRPVGVLAVQLAPGEHKTVEFTFGKIVQDTEPNVVVTPTVKPVKDVTLPTENAACG